MDCGHPVRKCVRPLVSLYLFSFLFIWFCFICFESCFVLCFLFCFVVLLVFFLFWYWFIYNIVLFIFLCFVYFPLFCFRFSLLIALYFVFGLSFFPKGKAIYSNNSNKNDLLSRKRLDGSEWNVVWSMYQLLKIGCLSHIMIQQNVNNLTIGKPPATP